MGLEDVDKLPSIYPLKPAELGGVEKQIKGIGRLMDDHGYRLSVETVQDGAHEITKGLHPEVVDDDGNTIRVELNSNTSTEHYKVGRGPNELIIIYQDKKGNFRQNITLTDQGVDEWEVAGITSFLDETNKPTATKPVPKDRILPRASFLLAEYQRLLAQNIGRLAQEQKVRFR